MNCIIVDDEPLARDGIQLQIENIPELSLAGSFNSAEAASEYLAEHRTDLIFLDINMPGANGIELAQSLPDKTLLIFVTAYAQYALHGYELDAVDYLVKPLHADRFRRAVNKALAYHKLLVTEDNKTNIESFSTDFIFVKADRKFFKIFFKDILFIEGLKDYVVLHTEEQRIITAMNVKTIYAQLPQTLFVRVSKSHIINLQQVISFDNHVINIRNNELPIGANYREYFFSEHVMKKLISR